MYDDAFDIILLSDQGKGEFPDNKPQSFKTRLAEPITLNGQWEVALKSIHYPKRCNNLLQDFKVYCVLYELSDEDYENMKDNELNMDLRPTLDPLTIIRRFEARLPNFELIRLSPKYIARVVTIPAGFYESNKEIFQHVTKQFGTLFNDTRKLTLSSRWNVTEKQGVITSTHCESYFFASEKGLFPYKPNTTAFYNIDHTRWTGESKLVIYDVLIVYCDLIHPSNVGSGKYPAIGCVPLLPNSEEVQRYFEYKSESYKPVGKDFIDTIDVNIISNKGDHVQFGGGVTIVTLSFRRKGLTILRQ